MGQNSVGADSLGSNESCFKCGGWGYLDRIGDGRSTPVAHGVGPQTHGRVRPHKALRQCPICEAGVRSLSKHLRKVHGEVSVSTPTQQPTPAERKPRMCQCSFCASEVREDRMGTHLARVHSLPSSPRQSASLKHHRGRPPGSPGSGLRASGSERALDATRHHEIDFASGALVFPEIGRASCRERVYSSV